GYNEFNVSIWPAHTPGSLTWTPDYAHLKWSESTASALIWFWVYIVIGIMGAFVISFYFSANTIIYYLMRREVDATDVDDVYLEQSPEDLVDTGAPGAAVTSATAATIITTETAGQPESPVGTAAPVEPAPSGE